MSDEKRTQFDYLLNAMELASQSAHPSQEGYGEKRLRLYEYVRALERKAAAYDALPSQDEAIGRIDVAAVRVQEAANALEAARVALTAGASSGDTPEGGA